ncbi:hypothetical protein [Micromonospora sp. CA-111912]|uniref:hypothetical protein n=1 Tax=Micromonospora sp. CA-111912 TaxID=3239955 RepID=UPI003D9100D4
MAAALLAGSGVAAPSAVAAPTGTTGHVGTNALYYQVVDADNDPYSGIYLRYWTTMAEVDRVYQNYMYYGNTVELHCGTWGEAVGPYANRRWHLVTPTNGPAQGQIGWIPDRYLNTPNVANQPTPGESECWED